MHAGLGDQLLGPALEGFGAAFGVPRRLPFGLKVGFEFWQLFDALPKVVFQRLELAGEIGEQRPWVNHGQILAMFDAGIRRPVHCGGGFPAKRG